jgi:hypothetical protein
MDMSAIGIRTVPIRRAPTRRPSYTPLRAARALVLVKRIVEDLVRAHHRAAALHEAVEQAESACMAHRAALAREELLAASEIAARCREELDELGIEVEDERLGVVDFPARAAGREVRLCWQWGEAAVAWWHEVGETHAQRKSTLMR